jgi:hypothetical protein
MNAPFFGERVNTPEIVESTDQDTNSPAIDSAPYTVIVPADTAVIDEPLADEIIPVVDAPLYQAPQVETVVHTAPASAAAAAPAALLNHEESEQFRTRWNEIQGKFVDEPRDAVQQADALVSEVAAHITQMFAKEHGSLESQWNQGGEVSTEDLRKALQHYRSFFNRLVV